MMSQSALTAVDETPCVAEEAAAGWTLVGPPPEAATKIPTVRPSTAAVVTGTAIRTARLFRPRRRRAGPWLLSIPSTSIEAPRSALPAITVDQRQCRDPAVERIRVLSGFWG